MIFAIDVASGRHQKLAGEVEAVSPTNRAAPFRELTTTFRPDGKELCFTSDSAPDYGTDFNSDLYILPLDGNSGGEPKNITAENQASDSQPGLQSRWQTHGLPAADEQENTRRSPPLDAA